MSRLLFFFVLLPVMPDLFVICFIHFLVVIDYFLDSSGSISIKVDACSGLAKLPDFVPVHCFEHQLLRWNVLYKFLGFDLL